VSHLFNPFAETVVCPLLSCCCSDEPIGHGAAPTFSPFRRSVLSPFNIAATYVVNAFRLDCFHGGKMTIQQKVLTLNCPSCGAPLGVSSDMERFACGYCGTEQIVERRGGTVTLKILGEAIAKVQVGTDRTAAELAIRRLRDDLVSLEMQCLQQREVHSKLRSTTSTNLLFGIASGIVATLLFVYSSGTIWSWVALAISVLTFWIAIVGGQI
jgi:predicted RNA-binding Zn-ribbon protein involved in translation (DUF1610 family)